jgi:hypothetical protein
MPAILEDESHRCSNTVLEHGDAKSISRPSRGRTTHCFSHNLSVPAFTPDSHAGSIVVVEIAPDRFAISPTCRMSQIPC